MRWYPNIVIRNEELFNPSTLKLSSFKLPSLGPYHAISQASHPETPLDGTLNRLEVVLRTCVDQPQQTFNDGGCGSITLEIDQRLAVPCRGNDRRLLRIVSQVMDI